MITGICPMHDMVILRVARKGETFEVVMDWEDYEPLIGCNMTISTNGYVMVYQKESKGRYQLLHRVVMGVIAKGFYVMVDHKNTDKLNNRRVNLRLCNKSQNERNVKVRKDSSTRLKGVYHCESNKVNPFHAYIRVEGKKKHLGCFNTSEKAAKAHDKYVLENFKEFGRTNYEYN